MVKSGKPTPDDKIEIYGDVFDQVRNNFHLSFKMHLDNLGWKNNR